MRSFFRALRIPITLGSVLYFAMLLTMVGYVWRGSSATENDLRSEKAAICQAATAGVASAQAQKKVLLLAATRSEDKASLEYRVAIRAQLPLVAKIADLDLTAAQTNRDLASNIVLPPKGQPIFPGC